MKTVAALAILWLVVSAAGHAQSINVTSPTTGNQWCPGTTYTITWTKSGTMPRTVIILLRRAGAPNSDPAVLEIASSAPNSGSYAWPIPNSWPVGDYFVRVRTNGANVVGTSRNFKIASCMQSVRTIVPPFVGPPRISGRISGYRQSYLIRDHRVRVVLKRGGALVLAQEYLLDAQGSCNYQFPITTLGTYEVTVEKAPGRPGATLNPCFSTTTPAVRTVVITTAAHATGNDFIINYNLAWGTYTDCW